VEAQMVDTNNWQIWTIPSQVDTNNEFVKEERM
jgi:hypothetical protein